MTAAIVQYCAATDQAVPRSTADFVRVIFRSLAVRYKEVLGWLKELHPGDVKRLHVIGGGSLNGHLMQMAADELGIPVVAGPSESTAMGNILVQLGIPADLMRRVAINSSKTKTYNPQ